MSDSIGSDVRAHYGNIKPANGLDETNSIRFEQRPQITGAPGLTWNERKCGWEARWQARTDLVRRGYPVKSSAVWKGSDPTEVECEQIASACRELQNRMLDWAKTAPPAPRRAPASALDGQVYFIGDGMVVKIGFSTNIPKRKATLQVMHPRRLKLLASAPGIEANEKALHRRFKNLRVHGEWFEYRGELIEYIQFVARWETL